MRFALVVGLVLAATASAGGASRLGPAASPCDAPGGRGEGDVVAIAWSPDGNQVAFARRYLRRKDYYHRVFLMAFDARGLRGISRCLSASRGTSLERLAWSPDGSRLLASELPYHIAHPQISIVNVDGSGTRRLAEGWPADWSPDGESVVFERDGVIYVVPSAGGAPRRLAQGEAPDWSPNGSAIAFARDGVRIIAPDGKNERRIAAAGEHPTWSPDGKQLAIVELGKATYPPTARVVVTASDGSGRRVLGGIATEFYEPTWLPDGRGVVLPASDFRLFPLDGTKPRSLAPKLDLIAHELSFSPDGRSYATATFDCAPSLVVVTVATLAARRIDRDCHVEGTERADAIVGSPFYDEIRAGGGRDRVDARGGDDTVFGGDGDDTLLGGNGYDGLEGGSGRRDVLRGGPGNDRLFDGNAAVMDGGPGNDLLSSDLGAAEQALGGAGNDRIDIAGRGVVDGGPGDDRIHAAGRLLGGPGDDHLWAWGQLPDDVRCGTGRDVAEVRRDDRVARDCERVIRR